MLVSIILPLSVPVSDSALVFLSFHLIQQTSMTTYNWALWIQNQNISFIICFGVYYLAGKMTSSLMQRIQRI